MATERGPTPTRSGVMGWTITNRADRYIRQPEGIDARPDGSLAADHLARRREGGAASVGGDGVSAVPGERCHRLGDGRLLVARPLSVGIWLVRPFCDLIGANG